jgi:hypothetical protein
MVKITPVSFSNYILINEDHQSKLISLTFSPSRSPRPSQTHYTTSMAPINALTVEKIIKVLPNHFLPKIDHEPTFEDIEVTTRLLNRYAISVPSMVGDGAHGHLGIIMTQAEYAEISTSPWVEPYNPNAIPIIPPGTNAVDAAQIARMHDEFCRIYINIINVDQALKRIILEAYDKIYTSQLEDYLLRCAISSALEILMHLKQT